MISKKRMTGSTVIAILVAAMLAFAAPVGPAAASWSIGQPDTPSGGFGYSGGKGIWCVWAPGKGVRCYSI